MANRNPRTDQRLSAGHSQFRDHRYPEWPKRSTGRPVDGGTVSVNRPRVWIDLGESELQFEPGGVLVCEYSIELHPDDTATAVESSVIWTTTGKGDEDVGVHFFERRAKETLSPSQLCRPHRISTVLPQSPLSYSGQIIQIRWSVRLRVFLETQEHTEDLFFRLGKTRPAEACSLAGDD